MVYKLFSRTKSYGVTKQPPAKSSIIKKHIFFFTHSPPFNIQIITFHFIKRGYFAQYFCQYQFPKVNKSLFVCNEMYFIVDGREKQSSSAKRENAKKRALRICFRRVIRRSRKSGNNISQEAGIRQYRPLDFLSHLLEQRNFLSF